MDVETLTSPGRRLKILTTDEIDGLYGRPTFTPDERVAYFTLALPEQEALEAFRTVKAQVAFVVQLGYFKAKHVFVAWDLAEPHADLAYVCATYFPTTTLEDRRPLNKRTRLKQQRLILSLCHYQPWNAAARGDLAVKAQRAARVSVKPVYIFRELLQSLEEHRIVIPGYSVLQDLVSTALTAEHHRVTTIVRSVLTEADTEAFTQLLEEGPGLYTLTQLKRAPKDFSAGAMKQERQRGEHLRDLYQVAQRVLPHLELSPDSIKYYASLVLYYSVYRLKRLDVWLRSLYLLCFVSHRYHRFHDHGIESLMYHVRQYMDAAHAAAKEQVYTARTETNAHLTKAGSILKLFTDEHIAPQTPFQEVQATAFGILDRPQLEKLAEHITTQGRYDETAFQWEHLERLAPQFKRHLRPVLLTIPFAAAGPQAPLLEAVQFLQTLWRHGRSLGQQPTATIPLRWVPVTMKRYLYEPGSQGQKCLSPNRYEFLVYLLLQRRLESGDICCQESVRFRSFDDDLLDTQRWQDKEALIAATGLPLLQQPIEEQLAELEQHLERRLAEVNQGIASGANTG